MTAKSMREWAERILKRRSYYRAVFNNVPGNAVLADLRRFCRAGEPALTTAQDGHTDIYATGMAAGRQEVFWRIVHHLDLDDTKILQLKETITND